VSPFALGLKGVVRRFMAQQTARMFKSIFKQDDLKTKYSVGEVLGTGNFAEVRLGTNKETGEKVAIKIIEPKDNDDERIIRSEIEILGKLDHPNIIRLIEIFEQSKVVLKGTKKMYIVMELVTGGELFDRIVEQKTFKESEARDVFKVMLEALVYMHSHGVVHRDLKPENILFASKDPKSLIKIADFGLAKLYDPESHTNSGGLRTM
jgi:serine/threonine protein kinase